jgi:hypothetical protein
MKISQKEQIWSILDKYDRSLSSFCDSLSNVIQEKSLKSDFLTIFRNYNNIDTQDVLILDQIIGNQIMIAVNS